MDTASDDRAEVLQLVSPPRLESEGAQVVRVKVAARSLGPLLLAWWLALSVGCLEVLILVARTEIKQHGLYRKGAHFLWMIPVSHLAIFCACGIILGGLARLQPTWGARVWTYPLWAVAIASLLLSIPGLRAIACVTLGCGLAAWVVPLLEARATGFRALVRGSALALGLVLLVVAVVSFGRGPLAEKRALQKLPPASSDSPNILLLVMDTVRADALGLYGYGRDTSPNLTRLARKGVRFDRAIAPASWTLPSHASMFTGRWPHELSVGLNQPLDSTYPTLAEFLGGQGYATAGFAANTYFCNHWYGIDRGFGHYEDYVVTPLELLRSSALGYLIDHRASQACDLAMRITGHRFRHELGRESYRKDAETINRDALSWLSALERRPFFVFLNYLDAHDPYITPPGFDSHFGAKPETPSDDFLLRDWLGRDKSRVPHREVELARDAYDDCIASLDSQIGRLFDELERRGLLDNTLVIVTSDHGEHFGEHGLYGHRGSVYRAVTHVPLILVGAGIRPKGLVVKEPVSLRDLPATIAEHARLGAISPFPGSPLAVGGGGPRQSPEPPLAVFDYRSGLPAVEGRTPPRPGVLASIWAEGRSYIRNSDGHEELYDLESDPEERHDLAKSPGARDVLEHMRVTLDQYVSQGR
jgi:arylsulfatase A-like enzyme